MSIYTDIGVVANHHGVDAMVPPRSGAGRPAQAAVRPRRDCPASHFGSSARHQQLSQDLKIPTKDPQPHVPTVAAEVLISTPIQTIARLQLRQLPTRSPGDAAVPGGIPQWPLAPDAEPERGLAWASTAALPVSPTRVDSPENESRDRTTHVGFDRSVVVAPASSPPPGPRCPPPLEARSHSGTRSPRHPRSPGRGGRTREVEELCHV